MNRAGRTALCRPCPSRIIDLSILVTVCPFTFLIRHNRSPSLSIIFFTCCPGHLAANHFSTNFMCWNPLFLFKPITLFSSLKDHSLLTNLTEITWMIHHYKNRVILLVQPYHVRGCHSCCIQAQPIRIMLMYIF